MSNAEDAHPPENCEELVLQGIGVCAGIVSGPVFIYDPEEIEPHSFEIAAEQVPAELARLETAILETRAQILEMQKQVAEAVGAHDAAIFDAHLLVVDDTTLYTEVVRKLETDLINVDSAFYEVANRFATRLARIDDPYLRERAHDLHDVTRRVLRNLAGKTGNPTVRLEKPHIIVAKNLMPSETAQLDRRMVLGFATDGGSSTSHTAIMARGLNITAVVGLRTATHDLEDGQEVLLDGYEGVLISNPTADTRERYAARQRREGDLVKALGELRETDSVTPDGHRIILSANIERKDDVDSVKVVGAEGIGLYRTEFMFLNRDDLPTEEEQYLDYLHVATNMQPDGVIIRTLDVGGDKVMQALREDLPTEPNPFLGWRAIRVCLERPDIFRSQLRAILRASSAGNVRLMYPMISTLRELEQANAILEQCRQELRAEGKPFDEHMDVGMMMEVPSAAITAEHFAGRVSFFSIGTNDLIQYTLGIDRLNERVSGLYTPTHPAVLKLIDGIVRAAHDAGIWVGICGEMAGDINLTPLLLGLNVDELSVGASLVPRVKKAIQNLNYQECHQMATELIRLPRSSDIFEASRRMAKERYPELFSQ
jgi:phosphotransferase system enzyme I (PtsI)